MIMPDCHEHPFDHTSCVHGGHDWCYHCTDELIKAERERAAKIVENIYGHEGWPKAERLVAEKMAKMIREGKN